MSIFIDIYFDDNISIQWDGRSDPTEKNINKIYNSCKQLTENIGRYMLL